MPTAVRVVPPHLSRHPRSPSERALSPSPLPVRRGPTTSTRRLRLRWLEISLGTGYDPATEPYASRLAETGRLADRIPRLHGPHRHLPVARLRLRPALRDHPELQPPVDHDAGVRTAGHRPHRRRRAARRHRPRPRPPRSHDLQPLHHPLRQLVGVADRQPPSPHGHRRRPPRQAHPGPRGTPPSPPSTTSSPTRCSATTAGTSTGANRVDLCRSVALRGVLGRDPAKIALARDALSPVFPYVTKGDGLYADGSFVQHTWVAYSGTYGQVMLDGLGRLFALLAGSAWAVTDPNRQIILDSVEHAYAPLIYNGLMMDSVNGRAISRGYLRSDERKVMRSDHFHGQGLIAAIALLAGGASAAERERWHARIKGWIERDTVTPILTGKQFGVADLSRLHAVAAAPVPAAPEPVGHQLFASMDRAVHRRPGWAANISMASERIAYYECGNGENPRGWHTGAGMLYWWTRGQRRPVHRLVLAHRRPLPAARNDRVDQATCRPGGRRMGRAQARREVGGRRERRRVRGRRPASARPRLHPQARKSWFCVADTVICLGAGITSTDGVPVETVVDNRNLGEGGTNDLTVGHGWAHLEGHGGWVFPGGTQPAAHPARGPHRRLERHQHHQLHRAGHPPLPDPLAGPRHRPGGRVVRVSADARGLAAAPSRRAPRDHRWLDILANSAACQAVAVRSLGLTAANFWQPGTVGPFTATAPSSALVRSNRRTAPSPHQRAAAHRSTAGAHLAPPGAQGDQQGCVDRRARHRTVAAAADHRRHRWSHPPL